MPNLGPESLEEAVKALPEPPYGDTVADHLDRWIDLVRDRRHRPGGPIVACVGAHSDIEAVWEPNPQINPRKMPIWIETARAYYKVDIGRVRGRTTANRSSHAIEKDSDDGHRVTRVIDHGFRRQPPAVGAAAKKLGGRT